LRLAYGRLDTNGVLSADSLLTLNGSTAREITRVYGRTDADLTYAGVDTRFFHPYPDEELTDLRERIGPGPCVVHSTDFSPIKRTDLAVEAFAVAAQKQPDAILAVTSTRDEPREVAAMMAHAERLGVAHQVRYLGYVAYEDLPRLYSLADVLLQTGTSSGSGATTMSLPVKEALACGTPAVRSHATDEDVEDGISGYLVDPRDARDTGLKLAGLLADRERNREMGEQGRRRIVERYNWDAVVDVVVQALDRA
jgi:glycosyltransferase involved in cell wall biosynthesis